MQYIFNFAPTIVMKKNETIAGTAQFEAMISNARKIAVIGHFNPDGDSVGSVTGLYHFLKSIHIHSDIILPGKPPSFLDFLDSSHDIIVATEQPELSISIITSCDLLICLDFNTPSRTESLEHCIRTSKARKILVDHHPSPETDIFDLVFSDPAYSSTCELLFWILMGMSYIENDVQRLDFQCANSLSTGMITDTNNFHNSVIPSTFEMSSLMMQRGIDFETINQLVFGSYSEERMRLMGKMLSKSMVTLPDMHAAYMTLSFKDQNAYHYDSGDSEGFVNLPLLIKGIDISAFFTECKEYIRVSLRSRRGSISVNELSRQYFNGAGHERAAGGRIYNMKIENVGQYFADSLQSFLLNNK